MVSPHYTGDLNVFYVPGNTCRCADEGKYSRWSDGASDAERLPKSLLLGCDKKLITVFLAHTPPLPRSSPAALLQDRKV